MKQYITTLALVVIAVTMSIDTYTRLSSQRVEDEGVDIVAELSVPFRGGENDSVSGIIHIKGSITESELSELMDAIATDEKKGTINFVSPLKKIF